MKTTKTTTIELTPDEVREALRKHFSLEESALIKFNIGTVYSQDEGSYMYGDTSTKVVTGVTVISENKS